MIKKEQLIGWINEHLEGSDKFLVEVLVKPGERIHVFIDGDSGIAVADCSRLSRYLETKLDREQEDFELTVSSHGADQPLRFPRQYRKNAGRSLKVTLKDGAQLTGLLLGADDHKITLKPETVKHKPVLPERDIDYEEIAEAKIVISFKSIK